MSIITLFCLVQGTSTPFSVDIDRNQIVDHLKDAIKAKKSKYFASIDADNLRLWRVEIPVDRILAMPRQGLPYVVTVQVQKAFILPHWVLPFLEERPRHRGLPLPPRFPLFLPPLPTYQTTQ